MRYWTVVIETKFSTCASLLMTKSLGHSSAEMHHRVQTRSQKRGMTSMGKCQIISHHVVASSFVTFWTRPRRRLQKTFYATLLAPLTAMSLPLHSRVTITPRIAISIQNKACSNEGTDSFLCIAKNEVAIRVPSRLLQW